MQKRPQMPSASGPKSTICEVKAWTTTTVKEAHAAKERYARISPAQAASLKVGSDDDEYCDVLRWVSKPIDEVLKLKARDSGLMMRCVECKTAVRPHRALLTDGNSPAPHFEHCQANPDCSRSDG